METELTTPVTTPTPVPTVAPNPAEPPAGDDTPGYNARRRGRVARLPKLHRDMVNRMLWNGVPYKNIVSALEEIGVLGITERNISSWATGGYLEWRDYQDAVLDRRLDQDHLLDHLRTQDAQQLSEVGLQAAAGRLSQALLRKLDQADNLEADLGVFSRMVVLLCRLNREIGALQKQRDEAQHSLGPAFDPARVKNAAQKEVLGNENYYSCPGDEEPGLENPPETPFLPAGPMSDDLQFLDQQEKEQRERLHPDPWHMFTQALSGPKPTPTPDIDSSSPGPNPGSSVGSGSLR